MNLCVLIGLALCILMARPAKAQAQTGNDSLVADSDSLVVQNLDESLPAGLVVLSGLVAAPEVGTAVVAELQDDDGTISYAVTGGGWQWQRKRTSDADWTAGSSGAGGTRGDYPELNSYTPTDTDRGFRLRATVTYTDGHGDDIETRTSGETGLVTGSDRGPETACWSAPSYLL